MPQCDTTHQHPELIEHLRRITPDEELLYDLAELYKVFGSLSPSIGTGGEGIEIRLDNARAVILPLAGGKSLKIIAESVNSETAQSLCDDIIERLKKDDTFLDNV